MLKQDVCSRTLALATALTIAGCGGGGAGSETTTNSAGSNPATQIASHWDVASLNFGMTTTRVKTTRTVTLHNDGNQVADYSAMFDLQGEITVRGCHQVQPGEPCDVSFTWAPTHAALLSTAAYPTSALTHGTELQLLGSAGEGGGSGPTANVAAALVPFFNEKNKTQWDGAVPFTLNNGHNILLTHLAWVPGAIGGTSCEATFDGDVTADMDGKILTVGTAQVTLSKGLLSSTLSGSGRATSYAAPYLTGCTLNGLAAGSYIVEIAP